MKLWRILFLLALSCGLSAGLAAQGGFTTVTGTVTDPNGLKYSCATISAQLITAGGAAPTLNGGGFTTKTSPQSLGCPTTPGTGAAGSFALRLADSGVIVPSNTTWQFTVNLSPGIAPPAGTGPQSFSVTTAINCATNTPATCTNNTIDISALLSAQAPAISNSGASVTPGSPNFSTQINQGGTFTGVTPGNAGQVLISNGPSAAPTYQDPNVSNTPMVLLSGVSATGTQTSSAVKIPIQSTLGILVISGAGITGSPSGCQIAVTAQQSLGGPFTTIFTQAFTPASTYQSFQTNPTPGFTSADNMGVIYSCAAYPSAGTISVTFNPQYASPSPSNGGFSNGTWVNTGDIVWNQITTGFSGNSAANACCTVTNYTVFTTFRILKPDGSVYDATGQTGGSWSITIGGGSQSVCGTGESFPVSGWLQSITTYISASTGGVVQPGQAYSNLYILRTLPPGGSTSSCVSTLGSNQINHNLTGFALSNFFPQSWQTAQPSGGANTQLPGQLAFYNPTNPSAGANLTFAPPTTIRIIVLSVRFELVTSTQAGNRVACVVVNQTAVTMAGGLMMDSCAAGIQPPGTTMKYLFITGSSAGSGGNTYQQTAPLPANLQIPAGITGQIVAFIQGIQSSDQIQNIVIIAQAYQEAD